MILQTGMRTDIPAFYSEWFINRIKEGFVLVRNPYNPFQVTKYIIAPDIVDLICFCTKNPKPLLNYLDFLSEYGMFWYVTINCYDQDMEPNVPHVDDVINDFKRLSDKVGVSACGWRYDPIILDGKYTVEKHLEEFERIASKLEGYTNICVISFVDLYDKVKRNAPEIQRVQREKQIYLGKKMVSIAKAHGMEIRPCGEGDFLSAYGANCNGCMTQELYEKVINQRLIIPRTRELRKECSCLMGNDIGAYNTCMHLCKYCYANYDEETVKRNYKLHNPKSPFLIGDSDPADIIHISEQKSWIDTQLSLEMFLDGSN